MIIATAGHIDHGKTALVKALTGVDTDRLPEEKRRGLTIDLGFAYRRLDEQRVLGFVDVPGHERFVHTMVAGVGAVDEALLIVAADDGPMPQTAEHLAILSLLGVPRGAIVVSKIDRATPERVAEVAARVRALAPDRTFADAPVFPVCSVTDEGIPELLAHLATRAADRPPPTARRFRMVVDRVLTIPGAGLVVTGPVLAGAIGRGGRPVVSPGGWPVRVRAIHADNGEADTAAAGQRCALNLALPHRGKIRRGDWIVDAALHAPTQRLGARVTILGGEGKALRSGAHVHIHIGAADVVGRVDVLGESGIGPGASGLAHLVPERAIAPLHGDRFVLRDRSATRTIGGGVVLDPGADARGQPRAERLEALAALAEPTPAAAFSALLRSSRDGADPAAFARAWNLTADEEAAVVDFVQATAIECGGRAVLVEAARWKRLRDDVPAALQAWHRRNPEAIGASPDELRALVPERPSRDVFAGMVERWLAEGTLCRSSGRLRLPGFAPTLAAAESKLWERVEALYRKAGRRPPTLQEAAESLGVRAAALEEFLMRMAGRNRVARVSPNRFFTVPQLRDLARLAASLAAEAPDGGFVTGDYRDRSGLGRNLAIEVLEFFDRVGVTRCANGRRWLVRSFPDGLPGEEP